MRTMIVRMGFVAAALLAATGTAEADDWHIGLNMRTDLGTRPVRIDAGVRTGRMDWLVVLDPQGLIDNHFDLDVIAQFHPHRVPGWSVFLGHRTTVFALDQGHAFHEKVMIGLGGRLPALFQASWFRSQWGMELAMNWLRHGGGLPPQFISFDSTRHFRDLVNFSLFVRFEFKSAF